MTIQDLGSLGELVAAIATIATLVYLAIQIRQNTRALRGTFHDSSVNRMQEWQIAIASNPDLNSIMFRALRGDELTEEERHRFSFLRNYVLIGSEAVYYQSTRGNIDPEVWQAQLGRLRGFLSQPGFREWWCGDRRFTLTESFERLIEQELQRTGKQP